MEELRKLRKLNDEVSRLRSSLRLCPFLSEEEFDIEAQAEQEVEESAEGTATSVQNEPIATADSKEQVADASQDRAEYVPTPRSSDAPRARIPAQRELNPCNEKVRTP